MSELTCTKCGLRSDLLWCDHFGETITQLESENKSLREALSGLLDYMEPFNGEDDCYACFGSWDEKGDRFVHEDCDFEEYRKALTTTNKEREKGTHEKP